jgi:hypothetical protein
VRIIFRQNNNRRRQLGLTLVEMMVATSLLVVMMLGLTAMFNQTQRAFRSGLKQVDVFEGGRAVMDLVARDIEQLTASKTVDDWSIFGGIQAPTDLKQRPSGDNPTVADLRTNVLHSAFLLNYSSQWAALGYRVLDPENVNVFNTLTYGSLYRFSTNFSELPAQTNYYFNLFYDVPSNLTNGYLTRIADGIVHFRLRFFNKDGQPIPFFDDQGNVITGTNIPPYVLVQQGPLPNEAYIGFNNDALPAMVEVELGILEPQTLKQAQSLPAAAQTAYLQKQAGKVHIFRQQIPIRNALR